MINHQLFSLGTFSTTGKIRDILGRWWDPSLHPRDRKGRFIRTFGSVKIGLSSNGPSNDISGSVLFIDGNTSEVLAVIRDVLSEEAKAKGFAVGDIVQTPKEYFDVIDEKARLDTSTKKSKDDIPGGLKIILQDTTKYKFKDINGNSIDNPFDQAVKAKVSPSKTPETTELPPVPPRPVAPAFKGDELVSLVESAGGDPEKLIQSLRDEELTIFDYETVGDGTFGKESTPIQIGAKKIKNGEVIDSFVRFINPGKPLGSFYYETEKDEKGWEKKDENGQVIYILDDNGEKILKGELKTDDGKVVDDEFLSSQESLEDVHRQFAEWLGDDYILVGHNIISFDEPILAYQLENAGVNYNPPGIIDTLNLSRSVNGDNGNKLTQLTEKYGIEHSAAHNAESDALATEQVLFKTLEEMKRLNVGTDQLDPKSFEEVYKEKMSEYILAKKAEKEAKAKLSPKSDTVPTTVPAPEEKSSTDLKEPDKSNLWEPTTALDPVESMKSGAEKYAESIGKTLDNTGLETVSVTPEVVEPLAKAYDALPTYDESAVPYFEAFRDETASQYRYLTETLGVNVEVTSEDPYETVEEMFADLRDNNRLKVLSAESTGGAPMFSNEQVEMFRAVHDAFGHAAIGRGFDRHGEEAAFRAHAQMYSNDASLALESVTRGQNASLIINGTFPPQKIAILPRELSEVKIDEVSLEPTSKDQAMSVVRQYPDVVYKEDAPGETTIESVITGEDVPVSKIFTVSDEVKEWFESAGISTSDFYEVDNDEVNGYEEFKKLVETAKKKIKFGSSVAIFDNPEFPDSDANYLGTRQFVSSDGGAGFALNGDEIISAFSNGEGVNTGAADAMLQLAVQLGGRRLDAFDTVLPKIYARSGFVTTARILFNDEFAPEDWNFEEYKEFNNGRPDVVFMAYDPNMRVLDGYKQGDGKTFDSYDDAAAYNKQRSEDLNELPQLNPPTLGGYEINQYAPGQTFTDYNSKFLDVPLSADEGTVAVTDTQQGEESLTEVEDVLLAAKALQDEGKGEPVDDGPPEDLDGSDYYDLTYNRHNTLLEKLPTAAAKEFVLNWPSSFEFVAKMREKAENLLSEAVDFGAIQNWDEATALAGLRLIEDSPETTEVLWRGMNVSEEKVDEFINADTMSISFAAFSSSRNEVNQYTTFHSIDGHKIILKLAPGAKAIPMVGLNPYSIIGEHVTSGEFEITDVEYDVESKTHIISIEQSFLFDVYKDNSKKFNRSPVGPASEDTILAVQRRVIQDRLGEVESAEAGQIKQLVSKSIADKLVDLPASEIIGASAGFSSQMKTVGEYMPEPDEEIEAVYSHLQSLEKSENKSSSVRKFFRKGWSPIISQNITQEDIYFPVFRKKSVESEVEVGLSQDDIDELIKTVQQEAIDQDSSDTTKVNPDSYNFTNIVRKALTKVTDLKNYNYRQLEEVEDVSDEERKKILEERKVLKKKEFIFGLALEALKSPEDDWASNNAFIGTMEDFSELISERFFDVTTEEGKQLLRNIAVSNLLRAWANTSNDSIPVSLAVQKAAEEEFRIEGAYEWSPDKTTEEETNSRYERYSNVYRRFLRAQYDETQKVLSKEGVRSVEAYRGYGNAIGAGDEFHRINENIIATLRPLSSFSVSYDTARSFAITAEREGLVVRSNIPAERIVSFSFTGSGCSSEGELVVLGPNIPAKVVFSRDNHYVDYDGDYSDAF